MIGSGARDDSLRGGSGIVDGLGDRWTRFWEQRQARKRDQLIAAGRAAIDKYTPSARRGAGPEVVRRVVPPAHREPAIQLRTDRDP